jgi:chaperonin GroEL
MENETMKLRKKTNMEIIKENNIPLAFLTNTVEEATTKAKIRTTMQIISKILCGTLGPYGSTTIIQDKELRHFASKDGYDLMNRINFDDEVARTILDMLRQVASNQVLTVGDGSTSAVVVANSLFSALTDKENKELFSKVAPKDIVDMLNDISEIIEEALKVKARPLSKDLHEIETVAMISTNNDAAAGKLIREIYEKIGEFGFISTEITKKKEKDTYEIKQGIEWQRGYVDSYFAANYENKKVIHDEEPRVFITSDIFTYSDLEVLLSSVLGDVCGKQKAELVIIANGYEEDVKKFLRVNRTKHLGIKSTPELVFTAVDIDQVTASGKNNLKDLAMLLNCEVYDKFQHNPVDYIANPARFLGRAEKIVITEKTTQVIGKELSEEHTAKKKEIITELRLQLEEKMKIEEETKESDLAIYELRRRISNLTDSTAIIHVAGKSQTERMTRERLFEDAIFASKSAIKHGVIVGGNISIPMMIDFGKKDIIKILKLDYSYLPVQPEFFEKFIDIVKDAFLESYKNVLNNSYLTDDDVDMIVDKCMKEDKFYNLKLHTFENFKDTSVINSVQTDIEIMRSCFSIIGILATSNQMITLNFSTSDLIVK